MEALTTLSQAQLLKELGFNGEVLCYYNEAGLLCEESELIHAVQEYETLLEASDFMRNQNKYRHRCSAPTVSQALDYLREEKGIACGIDITFDSDLQQWNYLGRRALHGNNWTYQTESFDTHPEAASELLTAVLNYLKEQKDE